MDRMSHETPIIIARFIPVRMPMGMAIAAIAAVAAAAELSVTVVRADRNWEWRTHYVRMVLVLVVRPECVNSIRMALAVGKSKAVVLFNRVVR
jgi:hypothetical protein